MTRLRVLTFARNDLSQLRDHYRVTLPAAHRVGQTHFSEAVAVLKRNPLAGVPLGTMRGVRMLAMRYVPFVLVYRLAGREIDLLRVLRTDQARP